MAFTGLNFRNSSGFRTDDPANHTYVLGSDAGAGAITRGGVGPFTLTGTSVDSRDKLGSPSDDPRIAGYVFSNTDLQLSWTLPNGAGIYDVRLGTGDPLDAITSSWTLVFKDGGSTLHTLNLSTTSPESYDANGVSRSAANWAANNTTKQLTFASGVMTLQCTASGSRIPLGHVSVQYVGPVSTAAFRPYYITG